MDGGSLIVNPRGGIIAGPLRGEESILTDVIDLGEVAKAKAWVDGAEHYARAEVLHLTVHWRPVRAWDATPSEEVVPVAESV